MQTTHHHVPSETTHGSEYRYSTSAPLHTPDEYTRPLLYHTPSNPEPYLTSSTSGSMENLFFVSGFPAPQIPPRTDPLHPNAYNEIRKVYLETFAEGCNALLETTWFLRAGADTLMEDKELCFLMDDLLRRYATIGQTTDYTAEVTCRALETKAVWKLLSLVRRPSPYGVPAANDPSTIELFEARARLDVLEHLLKNSTASTNPVSTLHYPDAANHSHDKRQEVQFWSLVGDFISQPSTNPISATGAPPQNADQAPDTLLHSVRSGLKNLENRDVVYSIMCIRHLVKRHAGFPDHLQANPRAGEADDVNKLIIARDFLRKQAGWHGTTHPIQRVCDMATRSWTVFPR